MQQGYIKLHRSLQSCCLWEGEKFTKGQAWVDLLLMANHADKKILYEGEIVTVHKGQFITSILKLSDKWKWDRKKTAKFLDLLEKEKMVTTNRTTHGTTIAVINWEKYQCDGATNGTTEGTTTTPTDGQPLSQPLPTNKNDKNVNNNNISSSEPVKVKKQPKVYSDNMVLNEAINDFIKHRRAIKAPMTDRAIELFIKKLNGMSDDPDEQVKIINTAIERGWKGIYPIEGKPKKPRYDAADKEERLDDLTAIENMYLE